MAEIAAVQTILTTFRLPNSIRVGEPSSDAAMWCIQEKRFRAVHERALAAWADAGWEPIELPSLRREQQNGTEVGVWFSDVRQSG